MACNVFKLCIILGIVGLGILVIGWIVVPKVVRSKIAEILPLKPDSESWDRWENLPVPIQYRVFIFQVNNPEEIIQGAIPNVTEVGPYIYNEKRIKTILKVDEENSAVEYEHQLFFDFNEELSAPLTEDDVLTVVNAPAVLYGLIVDNLRHIDPVIHLFNTSLEKMWPTHNSNPFFIKAKVRDYLFDGLPMYCNQSLTTDNMDSLILCKAFDVLHPKATILNDFGKNVHSFAYFKYKNITSDGVYKIDMGIHDVTKIGQILSWNNMSSLSIWKGESCNRILGTDTTVFRPYLEEDDIKSLYIYHTDVCRSIKLTYDSDTEYKGVRGRRYVPDKSFFQSVLTDSENHCFCPQSLRGITHYGGCLQDGVLELSGCQGAPAVFSYPHFLMADPIYQGKIVGLSPDINKHRIYLDLEPNTGYPLRAASRVQINFFLKAIPEVRLMKNLPNVLMPGIWLEEKVELTDELIDTINSQLLIILKILEIVKWVMIAIEIILFVGTCGYYFVKVRPERRKKRKKSTSLDSKLK